MAVTIKDVAKKAGYSITTVSRALNGYSDVNEETKKKILAVVKELKYQPNQVAQQLVTKRTNTIGLFSISQDTFLSPFLSKIIGGMADEATTNNYNVLIFSHRSIDDVSVFEQQCTQRGVGGAVLLGLHADDPMVAELGKLGFPVVLVDIPVTGSKATFVASNNIEGTRLAVSHLAELGHRNIGFINGRSRSWVGKERLRGFLDGCAENGLTVKDGYIFKGDWTKESGTTGARTLVEKNPELTALVAASDLMASGAIEFFSRIGWRVPKAISVVGFDDTDFANHTRPALTTIRQDVYGLGKQAARRLIRMVNEPDCSPCYEPLATTLVVRESTSPPR